MVADVLTSLGGNVTVIARSDAQLGEAAARGFQSRTISMMTLKLSDSYLVNTIPAKWFSVDKTHQLIHL